MTRLEMITRCVEDQIARGIVKEENKKRQIALRMKRKVCLRRYIQSVQPI